MDVEIDRLLDGLFSETEDLTYDSGGDIDPNRKTYDETDSNESESDSDSDLTHSESGLDSDAAPKLDSSSEDSEISNHELEDVKSDVTESESDDRSDSPVPPEFNTEDELRELVNSAFRNINSDNSNLKAEGWAEIHRLLALDQNLLPEIHRLLALDQNLVLSNPREVSFVFDSLPSTNIFLLILKGHRLPPTPIDLHNREVVEDYLKILELGGEYWLNFMRALIGSLKYNMDPISLGHICVFMIHLLEHEGRAIYEEVALSMVDMISSFTFEKHTNALQILVVVVDREFDLPRISCYMKGFIRHLFFGLMKVVPDANNAARASALRVILELLDKVSICPAVLIKGVKQFITDLKDNGEIKMVFSAWLLILRRKLRIMARENPQFMDELRRRIGPPMDPGMN